MWVWSLSLAGLQRLTFPPANEDTRKSPSLFFSFLTCLFLIFLGVLYLSHACRIPTSHFWCTLLLSFLSALFIHPFSTLIIIYRLHFFRPPFPYFIPQLSFFHISSSLSFAFPPPSPSSIVYARTPAVCVLTVCFCSNRLLNGMDDSSAAVGEIVCEVKVKLSRDVA